MTTKGKLTRHAAARADERLPFVLNGNRLKQIAGQIRSGKAKVIKRNSLAKRMYRVVIDGVPMKVVYNRRSKIIVTVIMEETHESHHQA
jgi:hypothetical protein